MRKETIRLSVRRNRPREEKGVNYLEKHRPTQNAYIERFNRTVRHEWLDMHQFHSVGHAQELATEWLWKYNNERPHTGIGGVPPRRLLMAA
ncbi:transposase [Pseudohongiella nitratireducens]|uniref:transposase n=1 Tax=Pseudohongiella nitratireducens TaxID=1768907 RepID=UPI0037CC0ED4